MVMRRRPVGRERPEERLPPDAWTARRSALAVTMALAASVAVLPAVASAAPPPGRAYELVSPIDDPSGAIGGLSTDLLPLPGISSDDGDRVVYGAGASLGPSWSGPANPMILGRRTATGWKARTTTISLDHGNTPLAVATGWKARTTTISLDHGNTPLAVGEQEAHAGWLTPDGEGFIFAGPSNFGAAPIPAGAYLPGVYWTSDTDVAPEWLSRPNVGIAPITGTGGVAFDSVMVNRAADTVVFSAGVPLTADAPAAGTSAVYARRNGELQLVSRLPGGAVASESSYLPNDATPASISPAVTARNQLAGGGRFVLFRVGGNPYESALYVRDLDRQVTYQLAGGGVGAPDLARTFSGGWGQTAAVDVPTVTDNALVFASRDGASAYFRVPEAAFAYEANLATGVVTPRVAISGPPLGLSVDGRRMIFLKPPATGSDEEWTLRFWDASSPDTSVVVGKLGAATSPAPYGRARVYRSSADGTTWTFTATGSPDPARPNVTSATQQLYRWSVGDAAARCLSCRPVDHVARTSGVNLTVHESIATESFLEPTTADNFNMQNSRTKLAQPGHSVSDDGRWTLFDSPDRLVAEDTNDVRDVYLWDRDGGSDGQLQLVSSGQGSTPSYALDLDPTGRNAFFSTQAGLVPADRNGNFNVYDARIGGGFPGSPESCVGEACRAPVIPEGPGEQIGSQQVTAVSSGPRHAARPVPSPLRVKMGKVTSRRLTLQVRVPGAGTIRARGKGLRTTTRKVKRARTYTVKVALSKTSRRTLARKGRVRLRVSVRFSPTTGKAVQKTVKVTIKRRVRSSGKGR